jgi:hypothetical protein
MTRDPWSVLVDVSPRRPVDEPGLDRARTRLDADCQAVVGLDDRRERRARRTRRAVAIAGVSVAAAAAAVILPVVDLGGRESPSPPAAQFLGVLPAAAVGLGCTNEFDPVPGLSDPDQVVARDVWGSLAPVREILYLVGDRSPEMVQVTSGPAVCDAIPVAVLHDEAGQRGIVVYRDVTEPFRGATNLGEVTVRGYAAKVLSPPAGHHFVSWTDDGGVRWFVEAAGVSVDELSATLTASLDDAGLATVPDGFQAVPIPAHDPNGTVYRWSVQYEAGGYVYLEVTSPARAPVETRAAWAVDQQYTTVGDARAVYLPHEQGGAGIRWMTEEASYRLVVAGADLPELREMAENLERVSPDDPRLPQP